MREDERSERRRTVAVRLVFVSCFLVLTSLLAPARAEHAQRAEAPPDEFDLDAIGAVRAGLGWSELYDARILSLSFEDHIRVARLSDDVGGLVTFGMDGQRPLGVSRSKRGFLATTLGGGFLFHNEPGPAVVLSMTLAPLLSSGEDGATKLVGFGLGTRAEVYPFYETLAKVVRCDRGPFRTYVLSGLHAWLLTRRDWLGQSGESYAFGLGFDLGRNVVLPVLGAALPAACASR